MKLSKKFLIAVFTITAITGCKKLDIVPTDRFSDATFWKVDANVYSALYNNYHLMYNSDLYFSSEALSDNAYSRSGDINIISGGNATAATSKFAGDWSNYYSDIKSCNEFLTFVNQNTTLSKDVLNRMIAETRFLRAFAHFNLTKSWGDVPLVTDNITPNEAKVIARTPKADVIKFIISELEAAIPSLPSKDALPASENGRITKGAALALEARVLLYQGDRMADVVTVCEKLMNDQSTNGTYSLNSSYTDLFSDKVVNKINNESILSLQYVPVTYTWSDFFDFAPLSVGGRVIANSPTQELVDDYIMTNGKGINEAGSGYDINNPYTNRDPRLTATIVYDRYHWDNGGGVNGTTKTIYIKPGSDPSDSPSNPNGPDEYVGDRESSSPTAYYWRKYFDPNALASYVSGLNLHLIRYAEVLLDYAEAKNSLGQMNAAVWNQTIGALRRRAGFTDPAALNYPAAGGDMTAIIRRERRVELAFEGLRLDDIKRWKIAEATMNGYAHGARFSGDLTTDNGYIRAQKRQFNPSRDYLWAIPANDLSLDKNLTQNPGY